MCAATTGAGVGVGLPAQDSAGGEGRGSAGHGRCGCKGPRLALRLPAGPRLALGNHHVSLAADEIELLCVVVGLGDEGEADAGVRDGAEVRRLACQRSAGAAGMATVAIPECFFLLVHTTTCPCAGCHPTTPVWAGRFDRRLPCRRVSYLAASWRISLSEYSRPA